MFFINVERCQPSFLLPLLLYSELLLRSQDELSLLKWLPLYEEVISHVGFIYLRIVSSPFSSLEYNHHKAYVTCPLLDPQSVEPAAL